MEPSGGGTPAQLGLAPRLLGSAWPTLYFRRGFCPAPSNVHPPCVLISFLSSQYITWSWKTRAASPAPFCSPSPSMLCHPASGEPSRKVEDRNWPILDQRVPGSGRVAGSPWDSPSPGSQNRKWQRRQWIVTAAPASSTPTPTPQLTGCGS